MSLRVLTVAVLATLGTVSTAAMDRADTALQARVEALAEQIQLRYQAYPPGLEPRIETLRGVLVEWNAVTPRDGQASAANQARMDAWLGRALRAVMPGGSGNLPPTPTFLNEPSITPAMPRPSVAAATARPARQRPTLSPTPSQTAQSRAIQPTKPHVASVPRPKSNPTNPSRSRFVGPRLTAQSSRSPSAPVEQSIGVATRRAPKPEPAVLAPADNPFIDDPGASPNPLRNGSRRVARRPIRPAPAASQLNLGQLIAEVRGYNAALRDLQGQVMSLGARDVTGLAKSAVQLDRLAEKRRFLDLYRRGLSEVDRDLLPRSPSEALIRELVRRKTIDLIRQTPPERRAERRALERLNDQLARQDRTASIKF